MLTLTHRSSLLATFAAGMLATGMTGSTAFASTLPLYFVTPDLSASSYTTTQQWDWFPANASDAYADSISTSNPSGLASAVIASNSAFLYLGGQGYSNNDLYTFFGSTLRATVHNFGGLDGSLVDGGTYVYIQLSATVYSTYAPGNWNTLSFTTTSGEALDFNVIETTTLFSDNANYPGFGDIKTQQDYVKVYLPDWTGDFKVSWTTSAHSVYDVIRIDTAIATVPEPVSLSLMGVGTLTIMMRRRR